MAKGESGAGGESSRSDWFYPVDGGSISVPRNASDGPEAGSQSECVDGVCPVPWAKTTLTKVPKTQIAIASICDEIKELLLAKNLKYGDSALNPVRVFSQASAKEQILVRIDDKLSRIKRGAGLLETDEDVINDLIGYLVLLKVVIEDENQKG